MLLKEESQILHRRSYLELGAQPCIPPSLARAAYILHHVFPRSSTSSSSSYLITQSLCRVHLDVSVLQRASTVAWGCRWPWLLVKLMSMLHVRPEELMALVDTWSIRTREADESRNKCTFRPVSQYL